ncbi:acyltransferase family protein [Mesorhizobium sp. ArgA1]
MNTTNRLGGFNTGVHGARGLFSIAVFLHHIANSGLKTFPFLSDGLPYNFMMSLQFAVELFFGISAIVISNTLIKSNSPIEFIVNRATRIFPVLWPTVGIITIMSIVAGEKTVAHLSASQLSWIVPANLLAVPGIISLPLIHPAAWSLSYEFAFYIMCGFTWWLYKKNVPGAMLLGIVLGVAICLFRPRAIFFFCGLLIVSGVFGRKLPPILLRHPLIMLLVFLASWMSVSELGVRPVTDQNVFEWSPLAQLPLAAIAFLSATIGLAGFAYGNGWGSNALKANVMQWFGTVSFSLYLWHPIVLSVVKRSMLHFDLDRIAGSGSQLLFAVLSIPPVLLVSWLSAHLLERRFMVWLRRHISFGYSGNALRPDPLPTP